MNRFLGTRSLTGLVLLALLLLPSCSKRFNRENPIPGNTLVIEFAQKIKYVMSLEIDGKEVPIRYSGGSKVLYVKGLTPGTHNVNIHSISYVFGPEFMAFEVDENKGHYLYIQSRKYRSAVPKNRSQVSIRAYRRKLKEEGIDVKDPEPGQVYAYFD